MRKVTVLTLTTLLIGLLWAVSAVWADDSEKVAMSRVRLTTEPAQAAQCTRLGIVSDESVKDLRKKIVRAGGDLGLLSFGADSMSTIHAEVFRCPEGAQTR